MEDARLAPRSRSASRRVAKPRTPLRMGDARHLAQRAVSIAPRGGRRQTGPWASLPAQGAGITHLI